MIAHQPFSNSINLDISVIPVPCRGNLPDERVPIQGFQHSLRQQFVLPNSPYEQSLHLWMLTQVSPFLKRWRNDLYKSYSEGPNF
jgi:hypothetical protein